MDRLAAMKIFLRVAERRSFSAVAREERTTQSAISKQVAALERSLGVRLLTRSTRSNSLTEEGARFLDDCRRIVESFDSATRELHGDPTRLTGTLRVAAGVGFGRMQVMPHIKDFIDLHPGLTIDLQLNDRFVDLIEDGIDVAFRIGELDTNSLIAQRIGTTRRVTVATPSYLKIHGLPRTPHDLSRHNCIVYTGLSTLNHWPFEAKQGSIQVRVSGNFQSNSSEAIREAVLAGMGVGLTPMWLFSEEIRRKRLTLLLKNYQPKSLPIHAVYPSNRRSSRKIQAFIEHFASRFDSDPAVSMKTVAE